VSRSHSTKNPARQRAYLMLLEYARTHGGNSPTERELAQRMADEFGVTYSTVRGYLRDLEFIDEKIKKVDGKIIILGSEWDPPAGE
jgi:hypothetical protein